jgi:hypothetical protein
MLFSTKSVFQDLRYFERGLDMVTLYIHLPPASDDIVGANRDARDVADENISKAQVIYSIIASTFEDSKRQKREGQPHFSFEIVGLAGSIGMYAVVPFDIVDVVKQAVISAYPAARLEEVNDYNIFSQNISFQSVVGGEFSLKESYAFPIATYQDIKRDGIQSLLSSMSGLQKDDGVAVQMLMRPADNSWRKTANDIATKKRKGKYNTKSGYEVVGDTLKQMAVALVKAPEEEKKDGPKEDISGLDRSVVEAIEDKTKYAGFETAVRLVVSSPAPARSDALLNNLVASFSLYDAPGKNGFKFEKAKSAEEITAALLLRAFPKEQREMILNAVELATLFHFPDQSNIPTSQLSRQDSKQVDGPRNMPEQGLLLGYNLFRGAKKPVRISLADRQRHVYVVGQTGTGKSTFLEDLALQDMLSGNGFAFVDPHGDTAERLLAMVPRERTEDVVYFSPAEMEYPMGLNLFEFHTPDQKDFLIQEALNMLYKLYDPQHQGIMGPRYEHLFRNAALTVMADPAGGTFVDIPKLFRDPNFVKQKLQYVTDQNVLEFWQKEMPQSQRSNEFGDVVSWFVSKFGAFLSNEMMRNIIGQTESAINLREIMDNKKILLVNLSKGRTGELNSKLLGMIFVMKFQAAAMSRASIPEDQRVDFSLYVDEFQNFSTDSFATIMSEARKYHLNLIVANQFTTQLTEEIRDAVFGNMGTIVSFRVGQNDVDMLSKYFQPAFGADDLLRVPNYNTIVRTLVNGVPTQPFSMATLPPLGAPNARLSAALKQLSAAKYGKPRGKVEAEIFERMKTIAPPPSAMRPSSSPWSAPPPGAAPAPSSPATAAPQQPKNSFLDEWLSKRKVKPVPKPAAAHRKPAPAPVPKPTASPAPAGAQPKPAASKQNQPAPQVPAEPGSTHKVIQPLHDLHKPLEKKNISSEALESQEIDRIAEELKKDLKSKQPKPETPAPADRAVIKPTQPHAEEVAKSEETELKLPKTKKQMSTDHPEESDTILIDKEGNVTFRQTEE